MKNHGVVVLICSCFVLAAFLGGMYIGRNMRGEEIQVSALHSQPFPIPTPSTRATVPQTNKKININTADVYALMTLEGIGEKYAQKIIEYRNANGPYMRIEELLNVPGIGETRFAKIKDFITTGG